MSQATDRPAVVEDPAAAFARLRLEARRDLKAMLVPSVAIEILVGGVGAVRGPDALWPILWALGTSVVVLVSIGAWASFFRGWRVLRHAGGL